MQKVESDTYSGNSFMKFKVPSDKLQL